MGALLHPEFNKPIDPSKAEANERLGLSKEEVAGYSSYHNKAHDAGGHIQTIDEWAKEQKRGIYHQDGYESPDLLPATTLKEGETWRGPNTNTPTPESPAAEELRIEAANKAKSATSVDLTDETLKAAKRSQLLKLMQGQGRGSSFLTGPAGDTKLPALGGKKLYGLK